MRSCPSCGRQVAQRARFCAHCGAALGDSAGSVETIGSAPAYEPPAPPRPPDAGTVPPTLVERVLGGDWRSAALVAAPTVLVGYALGLLASLYLVWTGDNAGFGGHSAAGFIHVGAATTAMALGSPVFTSGGGDAGSVSGGMAPLTITLLTFATFAVLLRNTLAGAAGTGARVATAVRAALLAAFAAAMLGFVAYADERIGDSTLHLSVSPGRIFGWTLLWLGLVGAAVATRPLSALRARADADPRVAGFVEQWLPPVEGALVALATAVVAGGVAGIAIFFAEAGDDWLDVVKALPVLLAYFVNLGVDVFQVGMGAALHASFGSGSDGSASLSLFDRHGASAGYFALLVLPPLAIGSGVAWMRRRLGDREPRLLARAAYRMALPAALGWVVLTVASRAGFSYGVIGPLGGGGHAGPQVVFGALIIAGWFLVLGFAAGRWMLGRPDVAPAEPAGPAGPAGPSAPRLPVWVARVTAGPVVAGAVAVALVASLAGAATAVDHDRTGDLGPFGGLFLFGAEADTATAESGSGVAVLPPSPPPVVSVPPPGTVVPPGPPAAAAHARAVLRGVAAAEETYFTSHGTYTADQATLGVFGPASVEIVRADTTGFCALAFTPGGAAYTYDSDVGTVVDGVGC